jgi:hypothetical protein
MVQVSGFRFQVSGFRFQAVKFPELYMLARHSIHVMKKEKAGPEAKGQS